MWFFPTEEHIVGLSQKSIPQVGSPFIDFAAISLINADL